MSAVVPVVGEVRQSVGAGGADIRTLGAELLRSGSETFVKERRPLPSLRRFPDPLLAVGHGQRHDPAKTGDDSQDQFDAFERLRRLIFGAGKLDTEDKTYSDARQDRKAEHQNDVQPEPQRPEPPLHGNRCRFQLGQDTRHPGDHVLIVPTNHRGDAKCCGTTTMRLRHVPGAFRRPDSKHSAINTAEHSILDSDWAGQRSRPTSVAHA